jgi:hypothetical protein
LIVWNGAFDRIHLLFPVASAVASAAALLAAWGARNPARVRERGGPED